MDRRPGRVFCQISMPHEDAFRELNSAGKAAAACFAAIEVIENVLLQSGLTPLQAQAVLVIAWRKVQLNGYLTPSRQESRDHEPQPTEGGLDSTERVNPVPISW